MKLFRSEFAHSYKNYSFGYCEYATLESKDVLAHVYEAGFLPYSGFVKEKKVFYMARSARINLKHFALNSENRRIAKRFDGEFLSRVIPISEFDSANEQFMHFCLDYFLKRHGKGVMTKQRLSKILKSGLVTHIVEYKKNDIPHAYVFEVSDGHMTHFWFSFYDLSYVHRSLGMWLMVDCARRAAEEKKSYFYLGTVYAEKALYKTNFDHLEYWDGSKWSPDVKRLRARGKTDHERTCDMLDEWKEDRQKSKK